MRWTELAELQRQPLDAKIDTAMAVLLQAFAAATRPAIAFSGGKDSTVLLHMIREVYPHKLAAGMPVIYNNTGMEFPECIRFARRLAADWRFRLVEAKPGQTQTPTYRYAGQQRIWKHLCSTGEIAQCLTPDGRLKNLSYLEAFCPGWLAIELERDRLVWPTGTLMGYWWCVDQYGWPLLGKAWSRLDARRINIDTFLRFSHSNSDKPELLAYYEVLKQVKVSQHCCYRLKKQPAERTQETLGVDLIFKGLMASESRSRAINFMTRGHLFASKRPHADPFYHCQPLATWTDEDIWSYIHRYNVPYAPLYDMTYMALDGTRQKVRRNGCMGCATDLAYRDNHLRVLRQTHPAAWRVIMKKGLAEQIRNLQLALRKGHQMTIFDVFPVDELVDVQPCVFDDLDGTGGQPAPGDGDVYDPEVLE